MSDKVFKLGRVDSGHGPDRIAYSDLEAGMIVEHLGTAWVVLLKNNGSLGVFGLSSHQESLGATEPGRSFRVIGELGRHDVEDFA